VAIQTRSEKLDLRLTPEAKQRITAAARATDRSISEFVLESSLQAADSALADRARFTLSENQWTAFQEALDAPPRDIARLRRLMEEPSVLETGIPE
jgi:uncharacterized protein (DUF1778 family)